MSAKRFTVDTNIFFYALDPQAGLKHEQATSLIEQAFGLDMVVTLQSMSELSNAVLKKRPGLLAEAKDYISGIAALFGLLAATGDDLVLAIRAQEVHNTPFWDALLLTTARRGGCSLLLSEDFQDGRVLEGVLIRNPFKLRTIQLQQLMQSA